MAENDDALNTQMQNALRRLLQEHLEEMARVTAMMSRGASADHDLLIEIKKNIEALGDKFSRFEEAQEEVNADVESRIRKLEEARGISAAQERINAELSARLRTLEDVKTEAGGALKASHWILAAVTALLGGVLTHVAQLVFGKKP